MYVNIRYIDGTLLPIWLFANLTNHEDWKKESIYIPYYNLIDDIQVSLGGCDIKKNFTNSKVLISDIHVDKIEGNSNFDEVKIDFS